MAIKTKPDKNVSKKTEKIDTSVLPVEPFDVRLDHFDKLIGAARDAIVVIRRGYGYSLPPEIDRLQDIVERIDKVKFYSDYGNMFKGYDDPFLNFKPY